MRTWESSEGVRRSRKRRQGDTGYKVAAGKRGLR